MDRQVDAATMQADVDITKNMRYRVIITGGMTAAEGKTVAEQIATNGGPNRWLLQILDIEHAGGIEARRDCTYLSDSIRPVQRRLRNR